VAQSRRFRARSAASTEEGREIASRIQLARRHGATNKQVAQAFGINERTVRKIVAGETPGTRIYHQRTTTAHVRQSPNVFKVDILIGYDENGDPVVRSQNVLLPNLRNRRGDLVPPTAFDALRFPDLYNVAATEARRMARQYGKQVEREAFAVETVHPVAFRNPRTILHTIKGTFAG
jgi:predicted transcriptional regulator